MRLTTPSTPTTAETNRRSHIYPAGTDYADPALKGGGRRRSQDVPAPARAGVVVRRSRVAEGAPS